MMYQSLYKWNVFEYIQDGKEVWVCDKKYKTITCVNNMAVQDMANMLTEADENSDRFEFWYEEDKNAEAV